MNKEILSLIIGLLGVSLVIYGSICLGRICKKIRDREDGRYIRITPEDVVIIREALVFSRVLYNKLNESNDNDFEDWVDKISVLQDKLFTVSHKSSATIEVSNK